MYNRILLCHKKEWNHAICSNMDGPGDYHSKWSKPDSDRKISYDVAYMWNLKKKKKGTNELISKTERDSQTQKQTYSYQSGQGEGER